MAYQLAKNIAATVAYYDVMDFPLTAFEIWKHLLRYDRDQPEDGPVAFTEVWNILHSGQLSDRVSEKNGFYVLRGREALTRARIIREKFSVQKLKGMKRLTRLLAFVPYVRMIGATGSLSMKHGTAGSDWDMFVVLRSGKIWMGRTILTGFLHLIGKRRHGRHVNNRACLNYFVTDDHLEITSKDLFSAHEYRFLIPLFSFETFQRFEIRNHWIQAYKPNFSLTLLPNLWLGEEAIFAQRIQGVLEYILEYVDGETWLGMWQKKKIERNPKTHLEGSLIEASDQALIFLPNPRGPRVFQAFKERLFL